MDGLSLVASEVGLAGDGRLAGSTTVDGWPSVSRGSGVVRFTKGGVIAAARSASRRRTARTPSLKCSLRSSSSFLCASKGGRVECDNKGLGFERFRGFGI